MANQHCRPLSSTTRLDKHTQLTTGLPWCHECSRLLVRIARGPRISSQQKQTNYHRLCLTLKSNSAYIHVALYLCGKIGLPVMDDKTLFVRPAWSHLSFTAWHTSRQDSSKIKCMLSAKSILFIGYRYLFLFVLYITLKVQMYREDEVELWHIPVKLTYTNRG